MKSQENKFLNGKLDFTYYKPINSQQEEFHKSMSSHKLLIGGYGSGKTYPAIHQVLFICLKNPGHEFLVLKNTEKSIEDDIQEEILDVANEVNAIKSWDKTKKNLILQSDTVIRFRPLTLGRAKFKGYNICGFLIDDPDIRLYRDVIGFLFSRLRNPPNVKANFFETIITANYEGHDWLWQTYMRGHEQGGNDKFAYWICPTTANPTLPEDFIPTLAAIHSDSWMRRFVYCDVDQSYTGLIYEEYDNKIHDKDLSWCFEPNDDLIKAIGIDVGVNDPTVVLKIACDYQNIYIYDEWYRPNARTNMLGEYLNREIQKDNFRAIVIDPASAKRDQKENKSVRDDLRKDYGIQTLIGNNSIMYGLELIKTLMTVDKKGKTHLFIDPKKCPNTIREIEVYHWITPDMSQFDELAYKEKPVDKDNHCCDAARYDIVYLKTFLKNLFNKENELKKRRERLWEERLQKLKMYQRYPKRIEKIQTERYKKLYYTPSGPSSQPKINTQTL